MNDGERFLTTALLLVTLIRELRELKKELQKRRPPQKRNRRKRKR